MIQVFLDMDGVLADFNGRFPKISGGRSPSEFVGEDDVYTNAFWDIVNADPRYFAELEPLPDGFDLYREVAHLRPIILTGSGKPETSAQKREWGERFFRGVPVVCTPSHKKCLYCQPGDVLIDDWLKYRRNWIEAGGRFIHHTDAKSSLAVLFALYPHFRPISQRYA